MKAFRVVAVATALLLAAFAAAEAADAPQIGSAAFPKVRDWKSVTITLQRSMCLGFCPAYHVTIHGDGTVVYEGDDCVVASGERRAQISPGDVARLVDAFRAADYFALMDRYTANVTDLPSYATSLSIDGKKKSVLDYWGEHAGMPAAVAKLEDEIDRVAGTERWVYGKGRTCHGMPVEER